MIKKEGHMYNTFKRFSRSIAAVFMAILLAMSMMPAASVYADDDTSSPIREAHRVKVGDEKYCLFVTHNVVLTPAEVEKLSDNELTVEILKRSGLYLKETNCRQTSHKVISAARWIRDDGSFALDESDIQKIRSASPSDGSPVKLHMDFGVSNEPVVEEEKPEEETKPEEESKPEDKPSGEESGDSENKDNEGKDSGSGDAEDKSDTDDNAGDKDDAADNNDADSAGSKSDEGSTSADSAKDDKASGSSAEDDKDSKSEDNTSDNVDDNTSGDDSETPGSDEESTVKPTYYSTSKLLSPELLFVVIATPSDAKAGEDICTVKTPKPEKIRPDDIDIPDDGGEGEEMLPELRTIQLSDRSGAPLEPTLKDGTPVNLTWVEPKKSHIANDSSLLDHKWLIGIAALLVAAAATTAVVIARRRAAADDDYEEE